MAIILHDFEILIYELQFGLALSYLARGGFFFIRLDGQIAGLWKWTSRAYIDAITLWSVYIYM